MHKDSKRVEGRAASCRATYWRDGDRDVTRPEPVQRPAMAYSKAELPHDEENGIFPYTSHYYAMNFDVC